MAVVIIEGILFVALLATLVALVWTLVVRYTPLGLRLRQSSNRRRIDRRTELDCPVHGAQNEEDMIRLPSGERICPRCYQDVIHGKLE